MKTLNFTLKVWQTAALTAPVLVLLAMMIFNNNRDSFYPISVAYGIAFCGLIYFVGMVVSAPCAVVLWLAAIWLNDTALMIKEKKLVLSLTGIGLAFAPFFLLPIINDLFDSEIYIPAIYALTIVAGIWSYPLNSSALDVEEPIS